MQFVKVALWVLTLTTLLAQASWWEAAFRTPRSYLRDLLGSVPHGLTVTEYAGYATVFGSESGWNFAIPSHIAGVLRERCIRPAAIEELSFDKIVIVPAAGASVGKSSSGEVPTMKPRDGCLIGEKSYGPERASVWLVLEGNRLQLRRGI